MKFVIDTDCLNFLLDFKIGKKILSKCEILIPYSILNELDVKHQKILKNYSCTIEDLLEVDRKYAGKLLHLISGRKDDKKNYLNNRRLSSIHNIGEAEGGAIAKKFNIPIVLLDQKAHNTLRDVLKYSGISIFKLPEFGIYILENWGTPLQVEEFKSEIKKRFHINF
ncbi:MAG: hypothetical protein ACTSWX_07580 [Promethearchaeota archaeon]